LWTHGNPVHPVDLQPVHVSGVDLVELAEPPPRVVAVVSGPHILRLVKQRQRLHVQRLRAERARRQQQPSQIFHFNVSRYAVTLWMSASVYFGNRARCPASLSSISTFTA